MDRFLKPIFLGDIGSFSDASFVFSTGSWRIGSATGEDELIALFRVLASKGKCEHRAPTVAQDVAGLADDCAHIINVALDRKRFFGGVGLKNFAGQELGWQGVSESVERTLGSGATVDEVELWLAGFFGVAGRESECHLIKF